MVGGGCRRLACNACTVYMEHKQCCVLQGPHEDGAMQLAALGAAPAHLGRNSNGVL